LFNTGSGRPSAAAPNSIALQHGWKPCPPFSIASSSWMSVTYEHEVCSMLCANVLEKVRRTPGGHGFPVVPLGNLNPPRRAGNATWIKGNTLAAGSRVSGWLHAARLEVVPFPVLSRPEGLTPFQKDCSAGLRISRLPVPDCRVGPGNFTPSRSQIPDMTLSRHPARAVHERPAPSVQA